MKTAILLCAVLLVGMYGAYYHPYEQAYPGYFAPTFASPLGYPPRIITYGAPGYLTYGTPGYVTYGRSRYVTW